jgi:hypothetical protein
MLRKSGKKEGTLMYIGWKIIEAFQPLSKSLF